MTLSVSPFPTLKVELMTESKRVWLVGWFIHPFYSLFFHSLLFHLCVLFIHLFSKSVLDNYSVPDIKDKG